MANDRPVNILPLVKTMYTRPIIGHLYCKMPFFNRYYKLIPKFWRIYFSFALAEGWLAVWLLVFLVFSHAVVRILFICAVVIGSFILVIIVVIGCVLETVKSSALNSNIVRIHYN